MRGPRPRYGLLNFSERVCAAKIDRVCPVQGLQDLNLHNKFADEDNVKLFEPQLEGIKVLLGAHHKWIIEKTSKKN